MKSGQFVKFKIWIINHYRKFMTIFKLIQKRENHKLKESIPENDVIGAYMKKKLINNDENHSNMTKETYVADLSAHYCLPTLITCVTADETSDPNLRITHYPPSNALH